MESESIEEQCECVPLDLVPLSIQPFPDWIFPHANATLPPTTHHAGTSTRGSTSTNTNRKSSSAKPSPLWTVHQRLVTSHPMQTRTAATTTTNGVYECKEPIAPSASIETVWQVSNNNPSDGGGGGGRRLNQRIAVYSGPNCPSRTLHVSLQLPDCAVPPSPVLDDDRIIPTTIGSSSLAWANFPEQKHPVLCCLVNRTTLCLWDVYPAASSGNDDPSKCEKQFLPLPSEGWTIPLPFECRVILPLSVGLLLQRINDMEDEPNRSDYVGRHNTMFQKLQEKEEEDDDDNDGFVLQGPPAFWKHGRAPPTPKPSFSPTAVGGHSTQRMARPPAVFSTEPFEPHQSKQLSYHSPVLSTPALSPAIPSLFSLHHPLEDVLPVTQISKDTFSQQSPFSDAHEQVLWVEATEWIAPDNHGNSMVDEEVEVRSTQLMVTYHSILQRHAIWSLTDAPPPPPTLPLYQQTRQKYPTVTSKDVRDDDRTQYRSNSATAPWNYWDDEAAADASVPPLELQMPFSSSGQTDPVFLSSRVSRDQALADALGVVRRASPRKSMDVVGAAAATTAMTGGANGRRRTTKDHTAIGSGFFSPTANSTLDVSHATTVAVGDKITPSNVTPGIPGCLHPKISASCLYAEINGTSNTPSSSVFLASNYKATGLLVIGVVSTTTKTLSLYTIVPLSNSSDDATTNVNCSVSYVDSISCISAVSIQAFPSNNFRTSLLPFKSRDILILQANGTITLFRGNVPITKCALGWPLLAGAGTAADLVATDLVYPVNDCCTVHLYSKTNGERLLCRYRVNVSLADQSTVAENLLLSLEAGLCQDSEEDYASSSTTIPHKVEMAIKIRSDCCRLFQTMHKRSQTGSTVRENFAFASVRTVLFGLLKFMLTGERSQMGESDDKIDAKEPWEMLCLSNFHNQYTDALFPKRVDDTFCPFPTESDLLSDSNCYSNLTGSLSIDSLQRRGAIRDLFRCLFDGMHLFYEDAKLSKRFAAHQLNDLASLLVLLAQLVYAVDEQDAAHAQLFLDYYKRDLSESLFQSAVESIPQSLMETGRSNAIDDDFLFTSFETPPAVLCWIQDSMKASSSESPAFEATHQIFAKSVCPRTRSIVRIFKMMNNESDATVAHAILKEGFTNRNDIELDLSVGVAVPLLDVLLRCRNLSTSIDLPGWSAAGFRLAGRDDLAMNISIRNSLFKHGTFQDDISKQYTKDRPFDKESKDGLMLLERGSAMLFPNDNRVHEACRLLCSSRPIFLRVARAVEVSDHDFERLKQKRLLILSNRSLAQPVGRGMLTIGRLRHIPAEPLPLPEICLKGRVPPTNATLNLDVSECPADMQVWPEFHNGVAAGLRVPTVHESPNGAFTVTRTWIFFNRPSPVRVPSPQDSSGEAAGAPQTHSHSHGGLLLALGLRGHLSSLETTDIYEYLTHGSATTTVGVLLGLAVNKIGSCDMSVSKMLCLHIPSLIPQHFSAIDVASTVQTAAVAAAGLLFQGSSHRMMTEFLLNEMGKRPDTDVNTCDREAYTLACGLALGTVNLGLGAVAGTSAADRTAGLADLHIEDRLIRYIVGGVDNDEIDRTRESNDRFSVPNASSGNDSERCSTIFESNLINTSVTAPGATLALGLIYMKSNNVSIASALSLPATHFLLEFVRADLLGLRVIARSLILWDEVEPSNGWIEKQVPLVVRTAYSHMKNEAKATFGMRSPYEKKSHNVEYDRRAIRQMYVHVVSAACFGLGLRFAGTGNTEAKATVLKRIHELHALREASDPVSVALRPEIPILETCLGCAAIALAMILAGTCDLEGLRVIKILRWRCESDSPFGIHMIYGMAIGLIFLGGGTCTIGREPEDIAALVTAFFPRFPMTTSDNQYHLQALRHLYTLAVKRRDICAIDVDTNETVHVTVAMTTVDTTNPVLYELPCLLRNSEVPFQELRVLSDKYYPLKFDLTKETDRGSLMFYIKKRNSGQPEKINPYYIPGSFDRDTIRFVDGLRSRQASSSNNFLLAFEEYFCDHAAGAGGLEQSPGSNYIFRAVAECLMDDTEEVLSVYLEIFHGIKDGCAYSSAREMRFLWDLQLLRTYFQQQMRRSSNELTKPLLNKQLLVPYLFEIADRTFILERYLP